MISSQDTVRVRQHMEHRRHVCQSWRRWWAHKDGVEWDNGRVKPHPMNNKSQRTSEEVTREEKGGLSSS
jgi:hypothetical protein